ncbi:MAG: hypothetical protein LBK25_05570 [Treponema sp.]|nr:hypothetical protein [Treponema sp.]
MKPIRVLAVCGAGCQSCAVYRVFWLPSAVKRRRVDFEDRVKDAIKKW